MSVNAATIEEVDNFLNGWQSADEGMKNCFAELLSCVRNLDMVTLEFVARPGVSYSLRPKHDKQVERNLFAIIDVIDDNPDERWLSVCFYGDMITDAEKRGEIIPGGLAGSDGYCFDVDSPDESMTDYLKKRLVEACGNAAG